MISTYKGFEQLEHTADTGIRVRGTDMKELLLNGMKGLLDLAVSGSMAQQQTKKIEIRSLDAESLVVDFLNEIIFLINSENWVPSEVVVFEVSGSNLRAELKGGRLISPRNIKTEVKSATYHNLEIKNIGTVLEADVYFDI